MSALPIKARGFANDPSPVITGARWAGAFLEQGAPASSDGTRPFHRCLHGRQAADTVSTVRRVRHAWKIHPASYVGFRRQTGSHSLLSSPSCGCRIAGCQTYVRLEDRALMPIK